MNLTGRKAGTRVVVTGGSHRTAHGTVVRKDGNGCVVRLWGLRRNFWIDRDNLEVIQPAR